MFLETRHYHFDAPGAQRRLFCASQTLNSRIAMARIDLDAQLRRVLDAGVTRAACLLDSRTCALSAADMASRADEVGSLVALTGLDEEEAGILLDAAGGDVEMAVSLHFGDQADEELYWSDEEADRLLDEELERGAKEKTAEFINRVQTKEQVAAQSATMAKRRDRKSRAKLRGEEAEALLRAPTLADAGRAPEGAAQGHSHESPAGGKGTGRFSVFAAHSDSGSDFDSDASASDGGEDSDASSSSEEWVDDDW